MAAAAAGGTIVGMAEQYRSGDALLAFDGEMRVRSWNAAAEALTGIRADDALGKTCWELLGAVDEHDALLCHAGCAGFRHAREGRPGTTRHVSIRVADGRRRVAMATLARDGEYLHVLTPAEQNGGAPSSSTACSPRGSARCWSCSPPARPRRSPRHGSGLRRSPSATTSARSCSSSAATRSSRRSRWRAAGACSPRRSRLPRMRELFDAIAAGEVDTVRRLVSDDATLAGCRNEDGVSARMVARYHGQTEIVGVLVDAGPELDVFEAAALGADERLDELLAHDRALVKARSADGYTPLHLACFFGHPQAARLLVERGADVGDVARNELKVQPLHSAAAARQLEIVELLLDRGADPNARQQGAHTPLDAARQGGDDALAELLLARGATP